MFYRQIYVCIYSTWEKPFVFLKLYPCDMSLCRWSVLLVSFCLHWWKRKYFSHNHLCLAMRYYTFLQIVWRIPKQRVSPCTSPSLLTPYYMYNCDTGDRAKCLSQALLQSCLSNQWAAESLSTSNLSASTWPLASLDGSLVWSSDKPDRQGVCLQQSLRH